MLAMFQIMLTRFANAARRPFAFAAAHRFACRQEGAAAVEFALVAAPFLALLFAIIETAIVFFAGQALETAAADSARLIMTGQAQANQPGSGKPMTADEFKKAVCDRIYGLFDCQNGIYVDVKKYADFNSVDLSSPVDSTTGKFKDSTGKTYDPGGPGDTVVVRLFYAYPVYVSLLGFNLSDMANGKRLIAATSVFRNEPYQ
jgi:Flp pilus assembly protein TadG